MAISVVIKLIEIIQYKLNSMRLIEEPVTLKTITSRLTLAPSTPCESPSCPKDIQLFRRIRGERAYLFLSFQTALFRAIIHVFCRLSSK